MLDLREACRSLWHGEKPRLRAGRDSSMLRSHTRCLPDSFGLCCEVVVSLVYMSMGTGVLMSIVVLQYRWFFQHIIIGIDFCHRKGVINRCEGGGSVELLSEEADGHLLQNLSLAPTSLLMTKM